MSEILRSARTRHAALRAQCGLPSASNFVDIEKVERKGVSVFAMYNMDQHDSLADTLFPPLEAH
jgi:hypothetical protein